MHTVVRNWSTKLTNKLDNKFWQRLQTCHRWNVKNECFVFIYKEESPSPKTSLPWTQSWTYCSTNIQPGSCSTVIDKTCNQETVPLSLIKHTIKKLFHCNWSNTQSGSCSTITDQTCNLEALWKPCWVTTLMPTSDHQRKKPASDPLQLLWSALSQDTILTGNVLPQNNPRVEQSPWRGCWCTSLDSF